MNIFDRINEDIKKAMLAKEKERLEALRAVKSAFLLAKTETGNDEITPEKEIQIIQKLVKQRRDSAEIYRQQNRADLYEPEEFQADVIAEYLPEQLSEDQIRVIIEKIIKDQNATSMKDMAKVMGVASKELLGKADGKTISNLVKSMLM